ncbi:DUF6538 domain-containing protein [Stutzerimonas kunmingensis]|uniref:DUF6538 domain-containing protein n=1 Tax=Stutzerimonas kunmingensis TaxID=1211807 RepID=UPI000C9A1C5B|nr:DUF6538 domain-containing protein [Stutzerimonas kunmingensis]PNG01064.1 integrase [Stutzerimonas kunmingensis]
MRDNLILRQHTYHVRLAIPEDVRFFFGGRKLLSRSLKTGLEREAKDRARVVLVEWKAQITAARKLKAEQADGWKDHAAETSTKLAAFLEERVLEATGTRTPSPVLPEVLERLNAAAVEPVPLLQTGISHQFDLRGKDVVGQITEHQKLVDFFKQATALHLQRDYSLNGAETDQLQAILSDPKQYKPRSPITPSRLDSFRTHLERKGTAAKTVDQVCRRVALFSSYLAKHGHPLTFDTVSAYLDQLTDKAGNPLTAKTKKQHVWSCSMYWKWACKYDVDWREQYKGQPSPFADHDLPVIKGESAPWEAFTKEDVEKLHALALEKKDQPLADLIAVGAYTGARLEEIGRIHRDNITFEDGVPISFHIEQAKTTAGEREVPIHPKIAGLFSSLLEGSKDGFLFEGGHNKYGNRLDPLSKRFGRLKTAAGFDKGFVFHSIRKTTITLMHQAGADIAVMPAVVGHETGLFSLDRYSAGPSMPQKRQVIELLSFDFP